MMQFVSNGGMGSIIDSISSREIAFAIWTGALFSFLLIYRPTRRSVVDILKSLLNPVLVIPLTIAAFYAIAQIFVLYRIGWWSLANLKATIVWLVTFAFVTMFEVATAKNREVGLGKITRDILTITSVLLFITELHSFPLIVELIALPIVAFIALISEMAKSKPEHAPVAKLFGCLIGVIGLSYLAFSVWRTVETWRETATWAVALEFLIPVILSIGFLPFLFGWRTYVAYSNVFSTISVFGIDKELVPYARWLAITRVRGDVELLDRWRQSIQFSLPSNKVQLKHSLIVLLALRSREASPPTVQPKHGWSPYLAMQFMTDLGVETGNYHQSFEDEWFASSPLREIGESGFFQNNLAYYIDGSEDAATALRIKLNVNDPTNSGEAEETFIRYAVHLLEQAVSLDAVERLKLQIASLNGFEAAIPFGSVTLTREEFSGGIEGGYSRKFEVARGTPTRTGAT